MYGEITKQESKWRRVAREPRQIEAAKSESVDRAWSRRKWRVAPAATEAERGWGRGRE